MRLIAVLLGLLPLALGACSVQLDTASGNLGEQELVADKIKLLVREDGLYRVTKDELAAHGLRSEGAHSYDAISLSSGPDPIPFLLDDDGLIFYGRASDDRYYAERPYILEYGRPGLAMAQSDLSGAEGATLDSVRQSIRLEENLDYISEARKGEESDVWFWSKLNQGETFTADFTLPFVADGEATLRLNTWGETRNHEIENDHDFEILVNDAGVGTAIFDDQIYHTEQIVVPAGILRDGTNSIMLDNSAEGAAFLDIVHVNWLELDYPSPPTAVNDRLDFTTGEGRVTVTGLSGSPTVLDITDADQPRQLTGWEYGSGQVELAISDGMHVTLAGPRGHLTPGIEPVVESNWQDTENQADLIVITTNELVPTLAPLAAAREAEELGVAVVPVNEIYDEFGYGAPSPEAIRDFVAYTHDNWQEPLPRYLLIVGDATSDYLGYLGETPATNVPSLMVPVQFSGETVSDSRLVDVDDDGHPDLAVGRWPVQTRQEVADLVERTLAYEERAASRRAIFATDGSEETFSSIADSLIDKGALERDYVDHLHGPSASEIGDLWQDGAWLATYIGHGSIDRWGKDDIFSLDEIERLDSDAIPIVLQLTCLTGLYSHPEQESLAEAMLRHPGGPVLAVAASSLTLSSHQEPFAEELLRRLQDSNIERVGDAFLDAKRSLKIEESEGLREVSDTFALFGDPSARISRP